MILDHDLMPNEVRIESPTVCYSFIKPLLSNLDPATINIACYPRQKGSIPLSCETGYSLILLLTHFFYAINPVNLPTLILRNHISDGHLLQSRIPFDATAQVLGDKTYRQHRSAGRNNNRCNQGILLINQHI